MVRVEETNERLSRTLEEVSSRLTAVLDNSDGFKIDLYRQLKNNQLMHQLTTAGATYLISAMIFGFTLNALVIFVITVSSACIFYLGTTPPEEVRRAEIALGRRGTPKESDQIRLAEGRSPLRLAKQPG